MSENLGKMLCDYCGKSIDRIAAVIIEGYTFCSEHCAEEAYFDWVGCYEEANNYYWSHIEEDYRV